MGLPGFALDASRSRDSSGVWGRRRGFNRKAHGQRKHMLKFLLHEKASKQQTLNLTPQTLIGFANPETETPYIGSAVPLGLALSTYVVQGSGGSRHGRFFSVCLCLGQV